ncbi:MAG: LacI family DNA-binding transcriptional regulator [Puniceicoccaceae bacterium]
MGRKRVSMRDIAKRVGVSCNAVSLALRNDKQISEAMREEIHRVAKELGYERNPVVGEVMARMRSGDSNAFRITIALVNANQDKDAFLRHPTIPQYVEGCERRATVLGCRLNRFWLYEPGMNGNRWLNIFKARGIQGVLLVGMMKQNRIPEFFLPVVQNLACTVTGVRTRKPSLSFACVDHHTLALKAFEQAIELGYKRPGLVLDRFIDDLVDGRFSSGYARGQRNLPKNRHLKPFYEVEEARKDPEVFRTWFDREKPDVIFTLYNEVRKWLKALDKSVPEDIGLIQLEWRGLETGYAGMNQHNDLAGESALDLLVGMIHNGEHGVPEFPRATLIGPSWVEGQSVIPVPVASA